MPPHFSPPTGGIERRSDGGEHHPRRPQPPRPAIPRRTRSFTCSICFSKRSTVEQKSSRRSLIPPGALVTLVQKGLQYSAMEVSEDNGSGELTSLQTIDFMTKSVEELRQIEKERNRQRKEELDMERDGMDKEDQEMIKGWTVTMLRSKPKDRQPRSKPKDRQIFKRPEEPKNKDMAEDYEHMTEGRVGENRSFGGSQLVNVCHSRSVVPEIVNSEVTILKGHNSEVFCCSWSPTGSILASGSGDSTARIWRIPDGPCGSSMKIWPANVRVDKTDEKNKDVLTLNWNGNGTFLATGSRDGQARIWSKDGVLMNNLIGHGAPIISLKWSKKGDYLLSGSIDKTSLIWDTKTWERKQQIILHSDHVLDVDWSSSISFATCSADRMIYVCKIGENRPIKTFVGHESAVNCIKWDPTGSLLASCSDDKTVKIWSLKLQRDRCVWDLKEHTEAVFAVRWSPYGPGTVNPNQELKLASSSFDSTIKLWGVEAGSLLCSFNGHKKAVYDIAFSPNGEYLASGSLDKCIHIWSVKEGEIVKTYRADGTFNELCWNWEGNRIAACTSNNTVCVMDFRM